MKPFLFSHKPPVNSSSSEAWRWLHELEEATPVFWRLLSQLGSSRFHIRNSATYYQGSIDLAQAFLNSSGFFLTTQPSLNLKISQIDTIYAIEPEETSTGQLEIDFLNRSSNLVITDCSAKTLKLITTLFGWELKPETPNLLSNRQLTPLPLCPCCANHAETRRSTATSNPLYAIFQTLATAQKEITFNLRSPGLNLVTQFSPSKVESKNGHLILSEKENELRVDVGYLFKLYIREIELDKELVSEISLINSHGITFGTICGPSALINKVFK